MVDPPQSAADPSGPPLEAAAPRSDRPYRRTHAQIVATSSSWRRSDEDTCEATEHTSQGSCGCLGVPGLPSHTREFCAGH